MQLLGGAIDPESALAAAQSRSRENRRAHQAIQGLYFNQAETDLEPLLELGRDDRQFFGGFHEYLEGLAQGDLDLISSDHAPYRMDETGKLSAGPDARFDQIANGLPGLETRLPLLFDAIISQNRGTPEQFVQLTATNAARLYGLPDKGDLTVGMDADITLWDAQKTHRYGADDLHDNVGYNPWEGRQITGWPTDVLLRGKPLVQNGTFLGTPGDGAWINRPTLATQPARKDIA